MIKRGQTKLTKPSIAAESVLPLLERQRAVFREGFLRIDLDDKAEILARL
jgi:hypothetical protein